MSHHKKTRLPIGFAGFCFLRSCNSRESVLFVSYCYEKMRKIRKQLHDEQSKKTVSYKEVLRVAISHKKSFSILLIGMSRVRVADEAS